LVPLGFIFCGRLRHVSSRHSDASPSLQKASAVELALARGVEVAPDLATVDNPAVWHFDPFAMNRPGTEPVQGLLGESERHRSGERLSGVGSGH
jgi:hypothetical protein